MLDFLYEVWSFFLKLESEGLKNFFLHLLMKKNLNLFSTVKFLNFWSSKWQKPGSWSGYGYRYLVNHIRNTTSYHYFREPIIVLLIYLLSLVLSVILDPFHIMMLWMNDNKLRRETMFEFSKQGVWGTSRSFMFEFSKQCVWELQKPLKRYFFYDVCCR
jgi:hypothetical protein